MHLGFKQNHFKQNQLNLLNIMKFFYALIITFLSSLSFSQDLNIKFIEQIIHIDFSKIENFMVEGYGFNLTDSKEKSNQLEFFKIPSNNIDNAIIIKIFNGKKINPLEINVAKNYSIIKIKQDFVENNYLYIGELEDVFWLYEKGDLLVMISKKPNKVGAHQIIVSNKK